MARGFVTRLAHRGGRDADRDQPDRHVDQEDPAPVQVLTHESAGQRAERQCEGAYRAPDADRAVALLGVGEGRRDDRQCRWHRHRGADALQRTGGDEEAGAAGQPRYQ